MIRRLSTLSLAVALALGGCSNKEQAADAAAADSSDVAAKAEGAPAAPPPPPPAPQIVAADRADDGVDGPGVSAAAMASATMTQNTGSRRFVRTAEIDAQVPDVQRAAVHLADLAARYGGFVTRDDVEAAATGTQRRSLGDGRLVELTTYVTRGTLQVRVPSDRAQAFLRAMAPELEFLDRRHYEAVDAQFELLRRELARQRHHRAQAALGAAAQGGKAADRIDAVDRVESQQAQRDEAIVEQRTYEDRVEFATLDVTMRQPERVRRAERPDVEAILRRESPPFGHRLATAIADGWRALLAVLVGLVSIWPLWVAVALAGLGIRARRRRAPRG